MWRLYQNSLYPNTLCPNLCFRFWVKKGFLPMGHYMFSPFIPSSRYLTTTSINIVALMASLICSGTEIFHHSFAINRGDRGMMRMYEAMDWYLVLAIHHTYICVTFLTIWHCSVLVFSEKSLIEDKNWTAHMVLFDSGSITHLNLVELFWTLLLLGVYQRQFRKVGLIQLCLGPLLVNHWQPCLVSLLSS